MYFWCDVFHLADVWTHYNDFSVKQFHLDLGRFVTLPNVAWDSWMHFRDLTGSNIEIKTVNDLDQYNFCERMLRGGLSQNFIPYARANLPDKPNYNPNLPVSNIYYVDVNSLYASCMRFRLPVSDFVTDYKIRDMGKGSEDPLEEGTIFIRDYEDDINNEKTKEEKYNIMFENAVNWKQGELVFFQEVSGSIHQ